MLSHGLFAWPPATLAFKVTLFLTLCSFVLVFYRTSYYPRATDTTPVLQHPTPARLDVRPRLPKLSSHGTTRCLPQLTEELIEEAIARNASCQAFAPFTRSRARIATISITYGERKEHIAGALQTHMMHSIIHGTDMHVMCSPIVDDLWNKPAFILSLLLEQMLLPEGERYEWLFWADRDTIILDQCRPTSSFLPPGDPALDGWIDHDLRAHGSKRNRRRYDEDEDDEDEEEEEELPEQEEFNEDDVQLIVNSDWNGLNNGVFLVRVSDWAVALFEDILAYRFYNPEIELRFTEQSAMENVIRMPRFIDNVAMVPQEWFNGYPKSDTGDDASGARTFVSREDMEGLEDHQVRRGDFLVHFAGFGDKAEAMADWAREVGWMGNMWEENRVQRLLDGDIRAFWKEWGLLSDA